MVLQTFYCKRKQQKSCFVKDNADFQTNDCYKAMTLLYKRQHLRSVYLLNMK